MNLKIFLNLALKFKIWKFPQIFRKSPISGVRRRFFCFFYLQKVKSGNFLKISENHLFREFEDDFFISRNQKFLKKYLTFPQNFLRISSFWHIFRKFSLFFVFKVFAKKNYNVGIRIACGVPMIIQSIVIQSNPVPLLFSGNEVCEASERIIRR